MGGPAPDRRDVVFRAASFAGAAAPLFEFVGALLTCLALVWLGLSLFSTSGPYQGVLSV